MSNEPDEMNEILQIRDSLSEFTQNEKPSPLMPLSQNEKSKCGKCKSDVSYFSNLLKNINFP